MRPLAALLLLQEALPPPPEPTASPEIDTGRVIAIVAVSLVVIVLLAVAARPLVVRRTGPESEPDLEDGLEDEGAEAMPIQPVEHAAIIPFPAGEGRSGAHGGAPAESISARLQRVTGAAGPRRKLGERSPAQPPSRDRREGGAESAQRGVLIPFQPPPSPDEPEPAWEPRHRRAEHDATGPEAAGGATVSPEPRDPDERTTVTDEERAGMSEHRNGHQEHRGLSEMIPDSRGEPIRPVDSVRWPEPPARPVLDDAILAAITQSVRELLFCANVGELLHGFSLYSASHLFRFMDETGLSEEEFHEVYGAVPPKSPEAWTRLAGLWEIERLSDGRIEATATYRDVRGEPVNGAERYRFALSPDGMFWAIDDIRPVEGPEA